MSLQKWGENFRDKIISLNELVRLQMFISFIVSCMRTQGNYYLKYSRKQICLRAK